MILDAVQAAVSSQLDDQSALGVQVTRLNDIPETGPTNKGVWNQILNASAVFVDLKNSTGLSAHARPEVAARAYTYFVRAMALVLERFGARYTDIQGDGLFGLFSGPRSVFDAAACAITLRTVTGESVAQRFELEASPDWTLSAGVGMDRGTLLVRRLGLRATKMNEVWAGKPVNMAAKLSSLAGPNEVAVSDRVFQMFDQASTQRRRALIWSCGCDGGSRGRGLDVGINETTYLWTKEAAPGDLGLDFEFLHRLGSKWCSLHGAEFCETIVDGTRPNG